MAGRGLCRRPAATTQPMGPRTPWGERGAGCLLRGRPSQGQEAGREPHTCQCPWAEAHSPPHRSHPPSPALGRTGPRSGHTGCWHSSAQPPGPRVPPAGTLMGGWLRVPACPSFPLPALLLLFQPVPGSQPSSSACREGIMRPHPDVLCLHHLAKSPHCGGHVTPVPRGKLWAQGACSPRPEPAFCSGCHSTL